MILSRWKQLNCITDNPDVGKYDAVWFPKYSEGVVYIARSKVTRSKLDIKLRFSKVSPTDEWYGDWFIKRSDVVKSRRRFNNAGLVCYVVPLDKLHKIEGYEDREW